MRLSWGDALKNKSGYNSVKKTLGYVKKKLLGRGGSLSSHLKSISSNSSSEPEKMRFESKPRKTNIFEKAAFMASILLQLNTTLYNTMVTKIKEDPVLKTIYNKFIDKRQIEKNRKNSKKTGHAIASICVDNTQVNQEKKEDKIILKSNASLVNKDGGLVIEYN